MKFNQPLYDYVLQATKTFEESLDTRPVTPNTVSVIPILTINARSPSNITLSPSLNCGLNLNLIPLEKLETKSFNINAIIADIRTATHGRINSVKSELRVSIDCISVGIYFTPKLYMYQ